MLLVKFVYFLDALVHKTLRFQFPSVAGTQDIHLIFKLLAFDLYSSLNSLLFLVNFFGTFLRIF